MRRWAAAIVAASLLVGGCERVARTVRPTSVDPCFTVLPQAKAAIGGVGTFVDVKRIRGERVFLFPRLETTTSVPPTTIAGVTRDICAVAFKGVFDGSSIPLLRGENRSGTYAIVIVPLRRKEVRAVYLTDELPPPLHKH